MTLEELQNTLDKDPYVLSTEVNKLNGTLSLMIERGDGEPEHHKIKSGNSFADLSDWINGISAISINAVREFCSNKQATFDFNEYMTQSEKMRKLNLKIYSEALYCAYKTRIYMMLASTRDHVELPIQGSSSDSTELKILAYGLMVADGSPLKVLKKLTDELIDAGWDIGLMGHKDESVIVSLKRPLFDKSEDD